MTYQEMPELLTIKQASQLINVHPNTLRNWERDGKISAVRIGSRRDRRFHKQALWSMSQSIITGLTQAQNPFHNFSQQYR